MTEWQAISAAPLDTVVLVWWSHPDGHGMAWPALVSEYEGKRSIRHADFAAECELPDLTHATLWSPINPPAGKRFSTLDESK